VTIRSREDLQTALRALGLRCSVEAFDGLAVAVPEPGEQRFASDDIRRRAIELARQETERRFLQQRLNELTD